MCKSYGTARELQSIIPDVHTEAHTHEEQTHEEQTHEEQTHEEQLILSISPQNATDSIGGVDGRYYTSCCYVIDWLQ